MNWLYAASWSSAAIGPETHRRRPQVWSPRLCVARTPLIQRRSEHWKEIALEHWKEIAVMAHRRFAVGGMRTAAGARRDFHPGHCFGPHWCEGTPIPYHPPILPSPGGGGSVRPTQDDPKRGPKKGHFKNFRMFGRTSKGPPSSSGGLTDLKEFPQCWFAVISTRLVQTLSTQSTTKCTPSFFTAAYVVVGFYRIVFCNDNHPHLGPSSEETTNNLTDFSTMSPPALARKRKLVGGSAVAR